MGDLVATNGLDDDGLRMNETSLRETGLSGVAHDDEQSRNGPDHDVGEPLDELLDVHLRRGRLEELEGLAVEGTAARLEDDALALAVLDDRSTVDL